MLQAEYIRNMHSNYLVLKGIEGSVSGYEVKMLLNNSINGMLKMELKCIDQMDLFYYDITSQKTLAYIYENKSLNYKEIKNLLSNILYTIELSYGYLLSENNFIVDPSYIYIDNSSGIIYLCHLVGYQVSIQEQLSRLIEYLMNKVDYKDEQAVLLIYAMYKESREVDCTFKKLYDEINKNLKIDTNLYPINDEKEDTPTGILGDEITGNNGTVNRSENNGSANNAKINNVTKNNATKNNGTKDYNKGDNNIKGIKKFTKEKIEKIEKTIHKPVLEEVESEREILFFDRTTYIYAGVSILSGIALICMALQLKLLYNTFGTQLDIIKVLCCILMICLAEVFIMTKVFDKKNRVTRMETNIEYIEQITEEVQPKMKNWDMSLISSNGIEIQDETQLLRINEEAMTEDMDQDKTMILAEMIPQIQYYLVPSDSKEKNEIPIQISPFIIGKLVKGVNLTIDDISISRYHAKLTRSGDGLYLTDLSSTNGTYINGTILIENKPYELLIDDEISFSQFKYHLK